MVQELRAVGVRMVEEWRSQLESCQLCSSRPKIGKSNTLCELSHTLTTRFGKGEKASTLDAEPLPAPRLRSANFVWSDR